MIHELTPAEAAVIVRDLAQHDPPLHVRPDLDERHVLHLWAQQEVTTEDEVFVLKAFLAHHTGRLAWHAWHAGGGVVMPGKPTIVVTLPDGP